MENTRMETDVILAINPTHLARIVSREKNHEFRKYRLKDGVERLWLYETVGGGSNENGKGRGRGAITHVALIPPNVRFVPGQVPELPEGIGNADFNAGLKASKYAYPIRGLYELVPPVTLEEMKRVWGIGAPMGWAYVKQDLWRGKWGTPDETAKPIAARQLF